MVFGQKWPAIGNEWERNTKTDTSNQHKKKSKPFQKLSLRMSIQLTKAKKVSNTSLIYCFLIYYIINK